MSNGNHKLKKVQVRFLTFEIKSRFITAPIFLTTNDPFEAFENFERALKLDSNDEQVLNNYAYFLSLENQNLTKAREMSAKVVARFPDNGTFLDTYAWILFQMGEYKEAEKYMLRAIEAEEEPSGVMLEHYGDILYHVGKKKEALAYWQKAQESPEASEKLPLKIKEKKYYE